MNKMALTLIVCSALAMNHAVYGKSRAESTEDMKAQLSKLASRNSAGAGLVTRPAQGRFIIASSQSLLPADIVKSATDKIAGQLKFPIECVNGSKTADALTASEVMKSMKGSVAIFLIDDAKQPMSLVAMEERWAILNVSKLVEKQTPDSAKELRLRKELSRICKALFSGVSIEPNSKAVQCGDDITSGTTEPIDAHALITIIRGMPSYGLIAPKTVPYYRACQEGWAPEPTNDVQKSIWDKVHAVPATPMKIEFDPKKGR